MKCATKGCKNEASKNRTICNKCRTRRYREHNKVRSLYSILRANAKRRHKEFDLTPEQFAQFCEKTGYDHLKGKTANSFSVDRIDNNKGYTFNNIRSITVSHNASKGAKSYMIKEEFVPTKDVPF